MDLLTPYNLIIAASTVIIISYFFGELARKTNIPSVLMLIVLGVVLKLALDAWGPAGVEFNFKPMLELLGIVGLIMIVLEAALELELKKEKNIPILKALIIALIGLLASAWAAAWILHELIDGMSWSAAWLYATPLSILSSAIIIPSVSGLSEWKKEFHIYESTFSDILGIMVFYFLIGQMNTGEGHGEGNGIAGFAGSIVLTVVVSFVASYLIVLIFQNIRSHVKLFLLIAVLLLLYALGKQMHLSSLIIILIFGLLIANMRLFFKGPLAKWLDLRKAKEIYEGLHIITMETAFVVRTFFFVIFGLTIDPETLTNPHDAMIAGLIIASIYLVRYIILRIFIGKDIFPQLFIAPRGLITILLFYGIVGEAVVEDFDASILLYVIIGTSLIMTFAMIRDKRKASQAVRKAQANPVGYTKWKAPTLKEIEK